ncbi:S41 family peptidase [Aquimarina hainanensis]|uniref:S41 family peptidase n=1 Tax=Aquimarina hainanensis TaxID=1578017 RepID=A0ABW5NCR4_9FLAO
MKNLKYIALLTILCITTHSCFKDNDDVPQSASTVEINNFIWRGMNYFYLYKANVPDLADNRFDSTQEFQEFLTSKETPEDFFDGLLSSVDEFSFLVDDYIALEQAFDGISKNNGMEFGLVRYPDTPSNLFGYVRYVLPDTDAKNKGITRGMIFNTIDGEQLTENNYKKLLDPDTYTIGLATYTDDVITPTNETVSLSKSQYQENPIFIAKTITVTGKKIGYLMYNSFTGDFDNQLNNVFNGFKSEGITDLVLDLRYNGGGSVTSAIDLSSMITGQFNGKVFSTEEWNSDRQDQFGGTNLFDNTTRSGQPINSLQLNTVYILTTRSSASASELVINGLNPYINVITIGSSTRGKFQASITLYDAPNFSRSEASPSHTYAIQPLVLKSINAAGFTDYFDGFTPTIEVKENFSNLGKLGDENEPLLQAAINHITGKRKFQKNIYTIPEIIGDSKMFSPNYQRMYKD